MSKSKLSVYFFAALLLFMLVVVSIIFWPYLNVFILSLVLGILFKPMYNKIKHRLKNEGLSAALSTLVVLLIILGPVALLTTRIVSEAASLYAQLQDNTFNLHGSIEALQNQFNSYFPQLNVDLVSYLEGLLRWVMQNVSTVFSGAAQAVATFLFTTIGLYYWFKDSSRLKEYMLKLSPLPASHDAKIIQKISQAIHSIIRGSIMVSIIQGLLSGIGYAIFQVPNPVIFGMITAISALIPGIGTALISGPIVIYLFITGDFGNAMGMLIWSLALVGTIDNFIGPKLMSKGGNIHPFFLLIAVLGGLSLLGPVGFLAGPLALSLFLTLLDIYLTMVPTLTASKE